MIHIDTHVALWWYAEELDRFPVTLKRELDTEPVALSPMVLLELELLHELGRVQDPSEMVVRALEIAGVRLDTTPFDAVAKVASGMSFTRDPFDRLIAGQARAAGARLATRDRHLREHLPEAFWD